MSSAKNTVLQAAAELFGDKDPSAVDRWVAADYKAAQRARRRRPGGAARARRRPR
ncbi:hypothetical protein QD712_08245 [Streptomyces acidiscabies]